MLVNKALVFLELKSLSKLQLWHSIGWGIEIGWDMKSRTLFHKGLRKLSNEKTYSNSPEHIPKDLLITLT